MFERVLDELPESVRACRRLYEPETGGYHLPRRDLQEPIGLADVDRLRATHSDLQFDSIETPVADLLCSLVINTRSRLILETGTSRGFSTAHLAAAARCVHGHRARVITLDPNEVPHRFYRETPLAASIDEQRLDSLRADPMVLSGGEPFDFLFLDSMHSFDHLGQEVARYLPHLRIGGLMALHDTFYYDGLGLLTLQLMQLPGLEALSFPTHRQHSAGRRSPGVTLFRKVAPIAVGSIRLPQTLALLTTELVRIQDPEELVSHLGLAALRAPYQAQGLLTGGPRTVTSPALLSPWLPVDAAPAPPITAARPAEEPVVSRRKPAPSLPPLVAPGAAALAASVPPALAPATVSAGLDRQPLPVEPARTVSELRRRAFAATGQGRLDEGIGLLTQALEGGPQDVNVLCDLATLALSSGDLPAAVKLSRHALAYEPDHASSLFALGMALARGGAEAPACRALQRVASGPGAAALRAELGGEAAEQVRVVLQRLTGAVAAS